MAERAESAKPRRARSRAPESARSDASVPNIVAALVDEHKYQARLLTVMERQVGLLNQRKLPDYEVMHGVMRYMTQFPDRFHHPKEDLLFDKVLARDPASAESVAQLRRAHVDITAAGAQLFDLVGRSRQGEAEALRDPLRKTCLLYTSHPSRADRWQVGYETGPRDHEPGPEKARPAALLGRAVR